MTKKKVAVIGGGPSGLTSIKACKEEDLDVVCFEKTDSVGGLWRYRDDDIEGVPSVTKSTVINTSKEMSAFSDFPPPADFPNYMHHSLMIRYFEMYAEHFDLLRHVKLQHHVLKVAATKDYEDTGRWKLTVRNVAEGTTTEEVFDGVMVCIGHHVYPNIPTFPGMDQFKGEVMHTHSFKKPNKFEDKRVVVVGIGNSAVDAAVDVSGMARQVYLSTRRGSWILYRVGPSGVPFDICFTRRWIQNVFDMVPFNAKCWYTEYLLNKRFNHSDYRLKPRHRVWSQHPTISDSLPNRILSGTVAVKGNIKTFTEDGVVFEGEQDVTKVDSVILATGYRITFPFIDDDIVRVKDNQLSLYKYVFPPHLEYPTMAFIGVLQVVGAGFPIFEMQARWFALLMKNKLKLPSQAAMMEDIDSKREANISRYVTSPRHTVQAEWIPYMDEIATEIGAKPNFTWMALSDPQLLWSCFTGPCLPYQYRLSGPHSWPGARDAILNCSERILAALKT